VCGANRFQAWQDAVMTSYLFVVLGAVLVNNVVFVRILGLCPFMGVSKKLETAIGMGAATTFVLTLGSGTRALMRNAVLDVLQGV
jgi:electron transport complex protein RnfA